MNVILNWDNHLVEWARRLDGAPFEWGRVDCLSAALMAMSFIVGEDVVEIKPWNDRDSFIKSIDEMGGPLVLLECYCRKVGLRRLQTGDLVWTPTGCDVTEFGSVTVVIRDAQLMVSPETGARLLPLKFLEGASGWRFHAAGR